MATSFEHATSPVPLGHPPLARGGGEKVVDSEEVDMKQQEEVKRGPGVFECLILVVAVCLIMAAAVPGAIGLVLQPISRDVAAWFLQ